MRSTQRRVRDRSRDEGRRRHLHQVRDGEVRLHPVMRVQWVPLRQLVPGTVARASVDFLDGTGHKVRPVVVAAANTHDVSVHTVTSQVWRAQSSKYVTIEHWEEAGLVKPSVVCLARFTVPRIDIHEVLGALSGSDLALVAPFVNRPRLSMSGR